MQYVTELGTAALSALVALFGTIFVFAAIARVAGGDVKTAMENTVFLIAYLGVFNFFRNKHNDKETT